MHCGKSNDAADLEYNRKTESTEEASRNIAENYDEEPAKGTLPKDVKTDERTIGEGKKD